MEEGEIGGKSREEGEKEKLTFREEGEIGSKSREEGEIGSERREKGDLPPVPPQSNPDFCRLANVTCKTRDKGQQENPEYHVVAAIWKLRTDKNYPTEKSFSL